MSEENVEIIRRMYERWLDQDPSLFEAFDDEIELHPDPAADWVGVNDIYRGHEGVRRYIVQVYEAFEDYRPEVEELRDAGDKVITLAIEHGRGKTSGAAVKAHRTAHVWTMRAGRAIRVDLYLDRDQAFDAVGLDLEADERIRTADEPAVVMVTVSRGSSLQSGPVAPISPARALRRCIGSLRVHG